MAGHQWARGRALAGLFGVLVAVALLVSFSAAFAAAPVVVHYDFPASQVVAGRGQTSRVETGGLPRWGSPGAPSLPYRPCSILLPPDAVVTDVSVTESGWETIPGSYVIEAAQRPVTLSHRGPVPVTPPDPAIYGSDKWFPARSYDDYTVQRWRGHSLLTVNLHPVRYLPARGQVQSCRHLSVSVSLAATDPAESAARLTTSLAPADLAHLGRHVDNPELLQGYAAAAPARGLVHSQALPPSPAYDYVIIAHPSLDSSGPNSLQDFAAYKQAQGTTTTIVHTDWIYANYSGTRPDGGTDNQTRIRNFITDAYNTWGTHYVLLVGDADPVDVGGESGDLLVPHRGFSVDAGGEVDDDIPSDLYYGCLDGTFDNSANGLYGEPTDGPGGGEVDLLAEVHVGRLCADSLTEVSNFVAKQPAYTSATPPRAVLMVGEYLGFGGVADWGGNSKDEIKDGCSLYGYTTIGFLNSTSAAMYDVSTLYDRDYPGNDWPPSELISRINAGLHVINHLGHANVDYGMKLYNSDVEALTNTSYFVGYSQGCYSGSFDDRNTSPGSYSSSDCIAEHLSVGAHGAVACIANSRYGWGVADSTDGPSQHFDREFWDALLGESLREMGAANDDSKWDQAGYVHLDPWGRWCCYETNLFGDPQLVVKVGVSSHGVVQFDRPVYAVSASAGIIVLDTDPDVNPSAPDSVSVQVHSSTETTPETVVCTETGASTGVFVGAISLASGTPGADGVLQVADGDVITVTYLDANDGSGGTNILRTATAAVDGQVPAFAGLSEAAAGDGLVTLSWSAASDTSPPIRYRIYRAQTPGGQDFGSPIGSTDDTSYQDTSVTNGQTYYYVVRAQDAVGNEETNRVEHSATPRPAQLIYSFPLDGDPGWTCQGGWQFGTPTGGGSNGADPTSGKTGAYVYGYNLNGDYPDDMTPEYLTSTAFDCSGLSLVSLRFWRWLGVENAYFDHAAVEVSADGSNWTTVWEHTGDSFYDGMWVACSYDISSVAAFQPTVYLRWRMGPTDGSVTYCGWDLDDVQIWGLTEVTSAGAVRLDRSAYRPDARAHIIVRDLDLDLNPSAPDSVSVQAQSSTETTPETVLCTETGPSTGVFVGHLQLAPGTAQADGVLQAIHGDSITVTYVDADDGGGGVNVSRTDTAAVDAQVPAFAGLTQADAYPCCVLLSWDPATDASPPIDYRIYRSQTPGGQDFGSPFAVTDGTGYGDSSITAGEVYYYVVRAKDAVGNEDANRAERRARPQWLIPIYSVPLDSAPGWSGQGGWQFGRPTGGGSHGGDPTSGYTGLNVYGYNLAGDYTNNIVTPQYLTSTPFDCSGLTAVLLDFERWLGVEDSAFDQASVEVSTDGAHWSTVWQHEGGSLYDGSWVECMYDVSAAAAQPAVRFRWGMGPTDGSVTYCGWNVDDVQIWGLLADNCLFPDVPPAYWAYNEIGACYAARLVSGYPDGGYRPGEVVTRDQMAVYIARSLAGGDALVPPGPPTATFPDVPSTGYGPSGTDPYWAYKHIEYLVAQHIVGGYPDGQYWPALALDRGQMAGFIARALAPFSERPNLPSYTPPPPSFPDVSAAHWAYKYVEYVHAAGVVGGYPDGKYHPEISCSRDQMAAFVARAFGLLRTADVHARIQGPPDGSATAEVQLDFYRPSDPVTPWYTRSVSLDGNGQAASALHVLYGTYNVRAKDSTHLARRLTGWSYAFGAPAVLDFGTLLAGDVNDDNVVNGADAGYLWLRWVTNDPLADINRDGVVDGLDLTLLNANLGTAGDP